MKGITLLLAFFNLNFYAFGSPVPMLTSVRVFGGADEAFKAANGARTTELIPEAAKGADQVQGLKSLRKGEDIASIKVQKSSGKLGEDGMQTPKSGSNKNGGPTKISSDPETILKEAEKKVNEALKEVSDKALKDVNARYRMGYGKTTYIRRVTRVAQLKEEGIPATKAMKTATRELIEEEAKTNSEVRELLEALEKAEAEQLKAKEYLNSRMPLKKAEAEQLKANEHPNSRMPPKKAEAEQQEANEHLNSRMPPKKAEAEQQGANKHLNSQRPIAIYAKPKLWQVAKQLYLMGTGNFWVQLLKNLVLKSIK
ncbi:hypothetical protein CROQUDRAFT_247126 [Cronartium quercuum f. sp. fusiforme G11]|uniref:Uncharacterized protein n=1 Tax=Cronartium quercuum f. sp. fusiforme G11 TaxID=708437 RepID=A0A9P6NTJ1_9BASI|nr:hypothetical protein CROQUDRAFT_247126 [Cronartium quercuum f. sp. fusiforme G11]